MRDIRLVDYPLSRMGARAQEKKPSYTPLFRQDKSRLRGGFSEDLFRRSIVEHLLEVENAKTPRLASPVHQKLHEVLIENACPAASAAIWSLFEDLESK